MLKLNKFESKYRPFVEFTGEDITELFTSVRVEDHCKNSPDWLTGKELWLELPDSKGKSVYVTPCEDLFNLLGQHSVFGEPQYCDLYLKLSANGRLSFIFQQIIGGYTLMDLTTAQAQQLQNLVK